MHRGGVNSITGNNAAHVLLGQELRQINCFTTHQLIERHLWALLIKQVPPCGCTHCSQTHISCKTTQTYIYIYTHKQELPFLACETKPDIDRRTVTNLILYRQSVRLQLFSVRRIKCNNLTKEKLFRKINMLTSAWLEKKKKDARPTDSRRFTKYISNLVTVFFLP